MDEVVTVSPKFQVVIPRAIRNSLALEPGQKLWAILFDDRIEYVPIRSMRSMRGFLRGGADRAPRDEDRT